MQKIIFFTLFFILYTALYAQNNFRLSPPIGFPVRLSGTFGELRGSHFHTGIDIKTKKKNGIPILAAAAGYVYKVRISPWGYGKVIYVRHNYGYSTVYAHLNKFNARLEQYIKKEQYTRKKHFLTINIPKGKIKVRQGHVIGYSGNTGHSEAPHLHFELRDPKDQYLNPLKYGISVKDLNPPHIQNVFIMPIENEGKGKDFEYLEIPLPRNRGNIFIGQNILVPVGEKIGLGIRTFDQQTGGNQNGVYGVNLSMNGKKAFTFRMDTLLYDQRKQIHLHRSFFHFQTYGKSIQKCFISKGNEMSIYKKHPTNPEFLLQNGEKMNIEITVFDVTGNRSTLNFNLLGSGDFDKKMPLFTHNSKYSTYANYIFQIDNDYLQEISKGGLKVKFPKKTFAYNLSLPILASHQEFTIGDGKVPALKNYQIAFTPHNVPHPVSKYVICRVDTDTLPLSTRYVDSALLTRTSKMGNFSIFPDTTDPYIFPKNIAKGKWMSYEKNIEFWISDNLSGVDSIQGFIDDKWIRFEYDPKAGSLVYKFSDLTLTDGKHKFRLEITDKAKNKSVWEAYFYRVKLKNRRHKKRKR